MRVWTWDNDPSTRTWQLYVNSVPFLESRYDHRSFAATKIDIQFIVDALNEREQREGVLGRLHALPRGADHEHRILGGVYGTEDGG